MNINPSFRLRGEYEIQCLESRRLRTLRRRGFARYGHPAAWRSARGYAFDGSASHFLALPAATRAAIERELVADILAHPTEWEQPELAGVIEARPRTPNLVLNQGFDRFFNATYSLASFNRYCAVGTGTGTPAVTDTSLGSELRRTGTMLTGSGNCGSSDNLSTGVRTYLRTHDFPVQVANENLSELGWSDISSSGANLNSRVLISGGTVTALIGQQLRVRHSLALTVAPIARQSATIAISGWPISPATTTAGEWQLCNFGFGALDINGAAYGTGFFEPALNRGFLPLFYTGVTLPGFGSAPTVSGSFYTEGSASAPGGGGWKAYTAGSFARSVAFGAIAPADWTSTAIRGYQYATVAWGSPGYYSSGGVLAVRFTDLQSKPNTHSLRAPGFTLTLSR